MRGSCPECNRTYEISDEFLAMGGKAKCPHCMLDLSFEQTGDEGAGAEQPPRSRRHPKRAPTRIAPDLRPAPVAAGADEVDAHCGTCGKHFKIDAEYLRMGGAAACPHCARELSIDPVADPRQASAPSEAPAPDLGAAGEEAYGQAGGFGLEDLGLDLGAASPGDGAQPVAVEDEREDFVGEGPLETEATALPTEVVSSPFVASLATAEGSLPDATLADRTVAERGLDESSQEIADLSAPSTPGEDLESVAAQGAAFQESLDGLSSSMEEELTEAADSGVPGEEARPEEPQADLSEEERSEAQDLGEEAEPERSGETVEVDALAAQAQGEGGVFSGLAGNDDWAEAAQRWARSGFKAEEMPGFIKATGGAAPADGGAAAAPSAARASVPTDLASPPTVAVVAPATGPGLTSPRGQAPLAGVRPDTVEVSDADILTLDDSEVAEIPAPAPEGSWAARAAEELKQKKAPDKPVVPARLRAQPAWLARLSNPAVLAAVLGVLVLLVVTSFWLFLGRTEDVAGQAFPSDGLKNPIVQAAAPAPYQTREEAMRHYGLGNRLAYAGDAEGAIAEYQAAQRIDPGFPHPHRALGAMFAALGQNELALRSYEAYLRLAPRGPDAAAVRGLVERARGR